MLITSPHNPRISKLRDLHTARGRRKSGLFLMEGPHLLESLLDTGTVPLEIYYQPELLQRTDDGTSLLHRLLELPASHLIEVSTRVMDALGDVQSSQGVNSVVPLDTLNASSLRARRVAKERPALLILDDVADPGNMGTILRTALAADVDAVLLTPHCVDCYSPKVVRAAAGAHIVLPVETNLSWPMIIEKIQEHCSEEPRILLADANSPHLYYEENLITPFALIIGNEAQGPSEEARRLATRFVSIPLANAVESLNAAIATGIILYEAVRQLRRGGV